MMEQLVIREIDKKAIVNFLSDRIFMIDKRIESLSNETAGLKMCITDLHNLIAKMKDKFDF